MARNPWYDSENDKGYLYEKALSEIPKDRYAEYDSLVHSGWDRAADRLANRIHRKSSEDYTQIFLDYQSNLMKAREIPGAANAVRVAEVRGYAPLNDAAWRALRAENELDQALRMIGRD